MTKVLILLLCCTYYSFASQHSHIIPVENYESELQNLGQYTETHDTPVKVIKITKTIAVKIPVPYPVKVIEKVPYPVHVNKPYPVEVPRVIHLPKERTVQLGPQHENSGDAGNFGDYQVQENYGNNQHLAALGSDYSQPPGNSYGTSDDGHHAYSYASEDERHSHYGEIKPYL